MFKKLKDLQNADLATRKRWLIVLVTISMVFIILGWIGFLKISAADFKFHLEVFKSGISSLVKDFKSIFQKRVIEIKK